MATCKRILQHAHGMNVIGSMIPSLRHVLGRRTSAYVLWSKLDRDMRMIGWNMLTDADADADRLRRMPGFARTGKIT